MIAKFLDARSEGMYSLASEQFVVVSDAEHSGKTWIICRKGPQIPENHPVVEDLQNRGLLKVTAGYVYKEVGQELWVFEQGRPLGILGTVTQKEGDLVLKMDISGNVTKEPWLIDASELPPLPRKVGEQATTEFKAQVADLLIADPGLIDGAEDRVISAKESVEDSVTFEQVGAASRVTVRRQKRRILERLGNLDMEVATRIFDLRAKLGKAHAVSALHGDQSQVQGILSKLQTSMQRIPIPITDNFFNFGGLVELRCIIKDVQLWQRLEEDLRQNAAVVLSQAEVDTKKAQLALEFVKLLPPWVWTQESFKRKIEQTWQGVLEVSLPPSASSGATGKETTAVELAADEAYLERLRKAKEEFNG